MIYVGAGSLHWWNTPFPSMLYPFEMEHCKVYFTSSTNPVEIKWEDVAIVETII